jgi:aquaporin Z
MFNLKNFLVEFIGTFALVFIGAAATVVNAGLVGIALACGFTLAVFHYAYGHISGAHINPAVTFGMVLNGALTWGEAVVYWLAQFAGAAAGAAFLHYAVTPAGGSLVPAATIGVLTESQPIWAMLIEIVLTFFLMNTILQTVVAGRGGNMGGLAVGMTFSISILAGGLLTGASLNPARTFGPALFSEPSLADPYTYVIYFFGPLLGATLAVMLNNFLNPTEDEEDEEEMEEIEDDVE